MRENKESLDMEENKEERLSAMSASLFGEDNEIESRGSITGRSDSTLLQNLLTSEYSGITQEQTEEISPFFKPRNKNQNQKIIRRKVIKKLIWLIIGLLVALLIFNIIILLLIRPDFRSPSTGNRLGYEPYVAINTLIIGMAFIIYGFPPEVLLSAMAFFFCLTKIVTLDQALSGYANQGAIGVGILFIVARGLNETRVLNKIFEVVLGGATTPLGGRIRLTITIICLCAFINNVALFTIILPIIERWAEIKQFSKRQILLPAGHAGILGGMLTIIGSTVNLIAIGAATTDPLWNPKLSIPFFEIALAGLPIAFCGGLFLIFVTPYLLKEGKRKTRRRSSITGINEDMLLYIKGYWTIFSVSNRSKFIGKKLEGLGLGRIEGGKLKFILRDSSVFHPHLIKKMQEGDLLVFNSTAEGVGNIRKTEGIQPIMEKHVRSLGGNKRKLFEVIINKTSNMVGKSLRQIGFKEKFQGVVFGIRRSTEAICCIDFGDTIIKAGDALIIETTAGFTHHQSKSHHFLLVKQISDIKPYIFSGRKAYLRLGSNMFGLLIMIIFPACGIANLVTMAFFLALLMVVNGTITLEEAKGSIKGDIIITTAASLGVAIGLQNAGIVALLSENLLAISRPTGIWAVIVVVCLCTIILTIFLSNASVVIIMIPISFKAAESLGLPVKMFLYLVLYSTAASFISPFSFQINLMTFSAGGYTFGDFIKYGVPLQLFVLLLTSLLCYAIYV